jgi:hypothetical protein
VIALAITMIALAITATAAYGASTRTEYVAQVDQICTEAKPQFQKLGRQLNKIAPGDVIFVAPATNRREKRRLNRLYRGLGQYTARAAQAFGAMVERLALVTAAPGDEAAVAQWVGGLRQYVALQAQMAPAWRHHKLRRVLTLSDQSIEAVNNGGTAVKDFGISACLVRIDLPENT